MAYSEKQKSEIFNKACKKIAEEGMPIREVLKENGMPSTNTFYDWISRDKSKQKQYARACEARADVIFDEILKISDGEAQTIDTKYGSQVDSGDVQHKRLMIDARKWTLSKMNPKKYGDKLDLTVEETTIPPEERDKRIKELLAKAKNQE